MCRLWLGQGGVINTLQMQVNLLVTDDNYLRKYHHHPASEGQTP